MIGLTPRQLDAAQVLAELGPRASLGDLARELGVGRNAAKQALLRLRERGWLADDLRTLLVPVTAPDDIDLEVTAAGRAYLAPATEARP